jgi:predicted TIM-barrel fold metal-dependent hydrolase
MYNRPVIIDFHTHIFPPGVREMREEYVRRDSTFAEMYGDSKATIATAEDLLTSMEKAGVDASVALGFAWQAHEDIVRHNDYLLDSARRHAGRIMVMTTANMALDGAGDEVVRCAAAGSRGIGELRPESQGWDLNGEAGERLAALAREHSLILLFHVTEVGGHEYPGKAGLQLGAFYRFQMDHPDLQVVGAHLGGGLALNAPESQWETMMTHVAFDTAAQPYLYGPEVYGRLAAGPFRERIVMGSDYPLITQKRQVATVRSALTGDDAAMVLGTNAARLLGMGVGRASG